MVLSDLTTRASGKARWICSPRLSVLETANDGRPPPEKSSGFDTSTSSLPARFSAPAAPSASNECMPAVQLKIRSPKDAASANVPALADPPA
jgi:hypothetical protein